MEEHNLMGRKKISEPKYRELCKQFQETHGPLTLNLITLNHVISKILPLAKAYDVSCIERAMRNFSWLQKM